MAAAASPEIDPRSGYCSATKVFHSLRPSVPLPSESLPLSVTAFSLSLLPRPLPSAPAFIDSASGRSLSFPAFLSQSQSLAASLQLSLSPGDSALVISPARLEIPVLYFSLLSVGAVPCLSNPLSTPAELSRQIRISDPKIAFAVSSAAPNLPDSLPSVIIDSPAFQTLIQSPFPHPPPLPAIRQSDTAAVLFSSGTTGQVKGVVLTHGNFIALLAALHAQRKQRETPAVMLFTVPVFHVFGFFMLLRTLAFGETAVLMERFDFAAMLRAVERFRVTYMPVSPPLVVAMLKSDETGRRDLSSLELLASGGAPLGREVAERFVARFPTVQIIQGYGLTETTGRVTAPEETDELGSVGRISANIEARIVDPNSGEGLLPVQRGELWLRGPTIMKGSGDTDDCGDNGTQVAHEGSDGSNGSARGDCESQLAVESGDEGRVGLTRGPFGFRVGPGLALPAGSIA